MMKNNDNWYNEMKIWWKIMIIDIMNENMMKNNNNWCNEMKIWWKIMIIDIMKCNV